MKYKHEDLIPMVGQLICKYYIERASAILHVDERINWNILEVVSVGPTPDAVIGVNQPVSIPRFIAGDKILVDPKDCIAVTIDNTVQQIPSAQAVIIDQDKVKAKLK